MNPADVQPAPWPLGKQFVDTHGRKFEVIRTIYGDENAPIRFETHFANGWSTSWDRYISAQTAVGFVQLGSDNLIVQPVELMDEYVKNGHLATL